MNYVTFNKKDPSACLASVDPRNICSLIVSQQENSLPERCIKSWNQRPDEVNHAYSPYYTACWFLFRNSEETNFNDNDIKNILLWASEFASDSRDVWKQNPMKVNSRLMEKLISTSLLLLRESEYSNLEKLWSNIFASLLRIGKNADEVPIQVAYVLAK